MNLLTLDPVRSRLIAGGDFLSLLCETGRAPINIDALAPTLVEIGKAFVDLYARQGPEDPCLGYLAVSDEQMVGTCGFRAPPNGGSVEIAYFTFPDFERRGWGKRMASALIELAWRETDVTHVVAHTLRRENASTKILRRLGFQFKGTVIDPEDGPVWCWHLQREALAA